MKKSFSLLSLFSVCLLLMAFQCDEEEPESCQDRLDHLLISKAEITDLANTSVCNENFECRYIAFGSKPCGGPWSYLVYSTSIDTLALQNMVEVYNLNEQNYNVACEQFSDCAVVLPPTEVTCEDGKCIAVY